MAEQAQGERKEGPRWLGLVTLIAGLLGLAWMIAHQDPVELRTGLASVGWWFLLACGAHLSALLLDSVTLRKCAGVPVHSPWLYIRASVAGHAINQATPFSKVGEITKYAILGEKLPRDRAVAALVAQNLVMFAANCWLIVCAPLVAFATLDVEARAAAILSVTAGAFLVVAILLILILKRGMGAWPFRLMRALRVKPQRCDRWQAAWQRAERQWRDATKEPGMMAWAWISAFLSRFANVAEAALLLSLLGAEAPVTAAFVSLAGYQLVVWLTPYVPFQAGTAEGGSYIVFSMLGFNPAHGVMLELVRKGRRVVFIVLGLGILGWDRAKRAQE